jgi:hypothetical protein
MAFAFNGLQPRHHTLLCWSKRQPNAERAAESDVANVGVGGGSRRDTAAVLAQSAATLGWRKRCTSMVDLKRLDGEASKRQRPSEAERRTTTEDSEEGASAEESVDGVCE